jgi:aldehyde dehydrogenase (NAD+)
MTFRTPAEAVQLANNTAYGLAASLWAENVNLALDIAPKLRCGVVWVNATNLFDAACGFGGVRESGFGREGGREGFLEYLQPRFERRLPMLPAEPPLPEARPPAAASGLPAIDRTAKLYIDGKQARPDGGYSRPVLAPDGRLIAEVGQGDRKDIRNAVEAARKAEGWGRATAHGRAQVIYYLAENLAARAAEFRDRLVAMTGRSRRAAETEVTASVRRLFSYGAWADKFEGAVHQPPLRGVAIAMPEPVGIIGIACPNAWPLLGLVSLAAPAIAMGNRVVAIPSERHPLSATDLYQVLDTSDVPPGVVNIVTGPREALSRVLAEHAEVDAVWYFGTAEGCRMVEEASAGNLKRTFVNYGRDRDWQDVAQGEGRAFLRQATEVKNVWIPYGE